LTALDVFCNPLRTVARRTRPTVAAREDG